MFIKSAQNTVVAAYFVDYHTVLYYNAVMHTDLIKIGNSHGIRLPNAVFSQIELTGRLELEVSGDAIIIRNAKRPRSGWAKAAAQCHDSGEDKFDDWDATSGD